jgi:HEAT repeat protein
MGRSCESRWLPLVIREMNSDEAELRYEAAIAAGSIADETVVPHVVGLASDGDEEVAQASIFALGEVGGADARRALEEISQGESAAASEAAKAALEALQVEEDPLSFRRV